MSRHSLRAVRNEPEAAEKSMPMTSAALLEARENLRRMIMESRYFFKEFDDVLKEEKTVLKGRRKLLFGEEAADKFFNGEYSRHYEQALISKFERTLSDIPPWKMIMGKKIIDLALSVQ